MSDEQEKRINIFHKGRQMWAYVKGTLLVAPRYHGKTHADWFEEIGMKPDIVSHCTRGFVLGDSLYAYTGNLMRETETVRDEALIVAKELDKLFQSNRPPLRVYCGMTPARPGDLWSPLVELDRTKGGIPIEVQKQAS